MISFIVEEIIEENFQTRTLVLRPEEKKKLTYQAGAYLTFLFLIDDVPYYRSYSFSSAPLVDQLPAITVKRIEGGVVSTHLAEKVRVGERLRALPPKGVMTLSLLAPSTKNVLFIGGGSGITPLFSLIKEALAHDPAIFCHLIDANRNEASIIYRDALADLEKKFKGRFQVFHILSQPSANWKGMRGRLTLDRIQDICAMIPDVGEKAAYLCAPAPLMAIAIDALLAAGYRSQSIHTESFVATEKAPKKGVDSLVTLEFGEYRETFEVAAGETILSGALEAGVHLIPYSCRQGTCDTCRVWCKKGDVFMETDDGLSKEEKEAGDILTCVAQPLTKKVTIVLE